MIFPLLFWSVIVPASTYQAMHRVGFLSSDKYIFFTIILFILNETQFCPAIQYFLVMFGPVLLISIFLIPIWFKKKNPTD